jgi:nitrogen fixation protein FixH
MIKVSEMKDGSKALIFTGLLFTAMIIANMTMLYYSIKTSDGLVEDDYYSKGLNYQQNLDNQVNQEKLGWQVNFSGRKNIYSLVLLDKSGKSIENASVSLRFFRPTQSGLDQDLPLREVLPGNYQAKLKLPVKGVWDIFINIRKDAVKWTKKQRISVIN